MAARDQPFPVSCSTSGFARQSGADAITSHKPTSGPRGCAARIRTPANDNVLYHSSFGLLSCRHFTRTLSGQFRIADNALVARMNYRLVPYMASHSFLVEMALEDTPESQGTPKVSPREVPEAARPSGISQANSRLLKATPALAPQRKIASNRMGAQADGSLLWNQRLLQRVEIRRDVPGKHQIDFVITDEWGIGILCHQERNERFGIADRERVEQGHSFVD